MAHNAAAVRDRNARWALWSSACPTCGWSSQALSREDAQQRAEDHNRIEAVREVAESLDETCYDAETMEYYAEERCPRCKLLEALRGAA